MDRKKLIKELEEKRESKVITYITSDGTPPRHAQIALDTIPIFYEHLKSIGKCKKIDLLIYSVGGDTITPWRLVNLIREYCDTFNVLIPYKAHSAATLLALGADEIVMSPLAELSPIDPSIGSPFNPPHPENPNEPKLEIGVEDVTGYINLAREKSGINDQDNLVRVFEKLVDKVHPLALGGIYRSHSLIRLLAHKLLKLHMKNKGEEQRIPQIVDNLAEKLFYHGYLISRSDAEDLGLKVILSEKDDIEDIMWKLYLDYRDKVHLGKLFDPNEYLGKDDEVEKKIGTAMIESSSLKSGFYKKLKIIRKDVKQPDGFTAPQFSIQEKILGWETSKWKA